MSQINRTLAQPQIKTARSPQAYARGITAVLALSGAIVGAAFMLQPGPAPQSSAAGASSELVDGYLPGLIAAHAAAEMRQAQALTDGWEGRFVRSGTAASTGGLRDGWEGSLLP